MCPLAPSIMGPHRKSSKAWVVLVDFPDSWTMR
jgi:hypothetical protein